MLIYLVYKGERWKKYGSCRNNLKKKFKMALFIQVVQKAQYMIRLLNQEFENHVGSIHEGH